MGDVTAVVFVIDDDPSMRAAIEDLVGSIALGVRPFASPQEFLASKRPDAPGCLVLDVRLPGMSGLTFQTELAKVGVDLPVIFITGHGDIRMSVRAMKAGAVEFLTKPFHDQDLLDAIHAAIEQFIPAGVAGILLTVVLFRFAPQSLWMLPGLWQIVFSLGIFASCRSLPRPMFAAGIWYLAAGLASIAFASEAHAFSPWTMAVPFGIGQFFMAGVLYRSIGERDVEG